MTVNVQAISFNFHSTLPVFTHVTFTINPGETICILGPNGTGKTTLIKCLAGLLKPTTGKITTQAKVAYVPQSFHSIFAYTALEAVVMGRSQFIPIFSVPTQKDYHKAKQALQQVGIAHLEHKPITKLSGGEKQLVLIARALVSEAKILMLDEPTAALDFSNQYKVLGLLHSLSKQYGYTIIFSSHRPEHPLFIADKSLLMYKNHPPIFGKTAKVITSNNLMKLYNMVINVSASTDQTPHIEGVVPILNVH